MAKSATARKHDDEQEEIVEKAAPFSTGENFADLFENSASGKVAEGSVVKGTVVGIEKGFAIVDVGLKSEGRVELKEFASAGVIPELKVGDQFDIYIERVENRHGEAQLSREKALREESWVKLELFHKDQTKIEGVIFGRVKGGFTVDIQGAVAFLPGSQVDIRPIKDVTPLMGIPQPFLILKMDRRRGNIVVSRRAVMEESRAEARGQLLDKIAEGQILDGIVKNITDYGAFIDMGGVDGLLHVTDISWKRINHPSEVFAIGDAVRVIVTKFDQDTKRISLGMKQLESNPWEGVSHKFVPGARMQGKITNITDYGAFVELESGIEGLVHVSEMSWTKKNVHPSKLVQTGQEVEVQVLDVDANKHRISLGMKQVIDNPWNNFAANHQEGDIIEGEVRNITDFGLFVGLTGDIDGLVHHSDISYSEPGEEAIKAYKKGDKVKARILVVDIEKERISLGIKQLEENPAGDTTSDYRKGQVVTCKVTAVEKDGIEVEIAEGVKSYIKKGDLSRDRQDQRPERFAVGDRVDAKVVSVDKRTQKVAVSIKVLEMDEHKRAIDEYGSSDSGATLGNILGAALEEASTKKAKK
ncbi:MAG: 30S ribosomal protein S1 [Azospirillum brasilense]|nr:MAG: 30S ribosomal protein S1 [Azospirillum brasilense]